MWWNLALLVWERIIRIVYRCLRLIRDVVARWGWIAGWVVVSSCQDTPSA